MPKFYVTFGCGYAFKDHYVDIEADQEEFAREFMSLHFGSKWAFIYDEFRFQAQLAKADLKKLCSIEIRNIAFGADDPPVLDYAVKE